MGGTNISTPMRGIIDFENPENLQRRIFCLTDGAVNDPDSVIELA